MGVLAFGYPFRVDMVTVRMRVTIFMVMLLVLWCHSGLCSPAHRGVEVERSCTRTAVAAKSTLTAILKFTGNSGKDDASCEGVALRSKSQHKLQRVLDKRKTSGVRSSTVRSLDSEVHYSANSFRTPTDRHLVIAANGSVCIAGYYV